MELIEIGRIVRSHGLDGRVKVLSYLESPAAMEGFSGIFVGQSAPKAVPSSIVSVQADRECFIVKLDGVADRDGADRLRGSYLWISPEAMPKLPEGEYYWRDIIGLQVVTEAGEPLGRIEAVFPTGSNDVYVCRGGGREILLPAIGEVIRTIDTDRGVMTVRLMKGLD